ncbi:MAG: prepilin-type N-terminal cleavage/methylation domain-containing protein, partial [Planctomycetota bacterium]
MIRRADHWARSAYTLIEVMIVLAIMTVLFAVSLPMMRKPLAKSELVRAAQAVQAALADARISAIESGTVAQFQYEFESGRYQVKANRRPVPRPALQSQANPSGFSEESSLAGMQPGSQAGANA